MATEKLIYASEARKAVLDADPKLAYCIDKIPGVDAVEVVRCKDCKHLGFKDLGNGVCNRKMCGIVYPDDFCSYGERRAGE